MGKADYCYNIGFWGREVASPQDGHNDPCFCGNIHTVSGSVFVINKIQAKL